MWTFRDSARAANNDKLLAAITVDPQLATEGSRTGRVSCCFGAAFEPHNILDLVALLPPGASPSFFLALIQANRASEPAHLLEYEVVFVHRSDGAWRIAMVALADRTTVIGTPSSAVIPRTKLAQGLSLLRDFGDDLESWSADGVSADPDRWSGTETEQGQRFADAQAGVEAAGYADGLLFFGEPRPSRVWIVGSPSGSDIVCGEMPESVTMTAKHGALLQDQSRANWGPFLEPGAYVSHTTLSSYFACLQTPDEGEHAEALGADDWDVSASGVPAG